MSSAIRALPVMIVLAVTALAAAPSASAASQVPTSLQAAVGNWTCTQSGPDGTTKSTYSNHRVSDLWIQGAGESSASGGRPASKSFFMMGYDPKKHVFVSMGASTLAGEYGMSTAPGAADAMTMTYTNAYPADPSHEKDVWHFTPTMITISSSWTEKGKRETAKSSCIKS